MSFEIRLWDGQKMLTNEQIKHYVLTVVQDPKYKLMWFTGRVDKNKKKIFQDDIVVFKDWKPKRVVFGESNFAGFTLAGTDLFLTDYDAEEMVAIGNYHENPGLLD